MADPNFSSVKLLLRANGSDGSTTITDESSAARSATLSGSAQLDTAQKKYGSASLLLPSTTSRVKYTDSADFEFGTGAFTVEMWVRFAADNDDQVLISKNDGSYRSPFIIYRSWGGGINFDAYNSSNALMFTIAHSATITENTWYHIAITRSGNTFRLFVDGVAASTATNSGSLQDNSNTLCLGSHNDGLFPLEGGWLDDVRITKGVARYTSNFTPPTELELGTDPAYQVYVAAASPLGAPAVLGTASRINCRMAAASPLGSGAVWGYTDPTLRAVDAPIRYVMDLTTPDGLVRIPISSWQATLQTDSQCYVQCVVPAAEQWVDELDAGTAFSVKRVLTLDDGSAVDLEMAAAPLGVLSIAQGARNFTATLAGYTDAYAANDDPPDVADRTLEGVQTVTTYTTGIRYRADIDLLARPGFRAFSGPDDEIGFLIDYLNMYCTDGQQYMDIGERTEG